MDKLILGLLVLSSRTIYELRSRIDKGLSMMYSSSTGSIQAALRSLLLHGSIDYEEVVENGKKKKKYFITPKGRQVFEEWVNHPVEESGMKCPELAKIYFMGMSRAENRPDNIRKYIEELNKRYEALNLICLEAEKMIQESFSKNTDQSVRDIVFFQTASARFGRDILLFTKQWFEKLLNEMGISNE